jgi:CheY-like chemotaxis protein
MDVRMPNMDGVTAASLIRSSHGPNGSTPIIAFTASLLNAQDASAFDQVVVKPIVPRDLLTTIASAVAKARLGPTEDLFSPPATDYHGLGVQYTGS